MTDFTNIDELFTHFQKESAQIVLTGFVKEGPTELTIQYSPKGCETWIDIEKSSITKATYIGKSRCVKAGEQPHFHPLIKLYIDGSVEHSSHLRIIATLTAKPAAARPLSPTERSASMRSNARLLRYKCGEGATGYSACGDSVICNGKTYDALPDERVFWDEDGCWVEPCDECQ